MKKKRKGPTSGAVRYGHSSHVANGRNKFVSHLDKRGFFDGRIAKERRLLGLPTRNLTIGYDVGSSDGDYAVITERLPDGSLRVVDMQFSTERKHEEQS